MIPILVQAEQNSNNQVEGYLHEQERHYGNEIAFNYLNFYKLFSCILFNINLHLILLLIINLRIPPPFFQKNFCQTSMCLTQKGIDFRMCLYGFDIAFLYYPLVKAIINFYTPFLFVQALTKHLKNWHRCWGYETTDCFMPRSSRTTTPIGFDPEIEKTARKPNK